MVDEINLQVRAGVTVDYPVPADARWNSARPVSCRSMGVLLFVAISGSATAGGKLGDIFSVDETGAWSLHCETTSGWSSSIRGACRLPTAAIC